MGIECLDQLGEDGEGAGQPIELIDDDHVDSSGLHIGQELLQGRPVYRRQRRRPPSSRRIRRDQRRRHSRDANRPRLSSGHLGSATL